MVFVWQIGCTPRAFRRRVHGTCAMVNALMVVHEHLRVKMRLPLVYRAVDLFAERDPKTGGFVS